MITNTETIPINLDAEQTLLGSIMRDSSAMDLVLPNLPFEEAFYTPRHRKLYRAMIDLHNAQQPIDITTVANALQSSGGLAEAGGRTYIAELFETAGTSAHVVHYVEILKDKWLKRHLIEVANEASRAAVLDESPAIDILRKFESLLYSIGQRSTSGEPVDMASTIADFTDGLIRGDSMMARPYLETRVADFNQRFKLFYGDYVIIGGEPSQGKTMFALDLVWYNIYAGKKALIVSYDQSCQAIMARYLSNTTALSRDQMYSGKLAIKDQDTLCRAATKLAANGGVYIQDDASLTIYDIWSQARKLKRQVGLDLLVIDYVQLIPPHRRSENRNLELADISRVLTAMKKDLNVVLVVVSQINRTIKDRARIDPMNNVWRFPNMHMLRDSGALTQDATVVIFPYIPHEACKREYGEQSKTFTDVCLEYEGKFGVPLDRMGYLVVDKNKDGETGVVSCRRDPVRMRFYSESRFNDAPF